MGIPGQVWSSDTVSALAYSLAQGHSNLPVLQPPFNDLARFVLQQRAQMPDYLRWPMFAATLGFDASGCLSNAGFFHSRPAEVRARQLASWKRSRLAFRRDLVRYYESLALLALYSRLSPDTKPESSNHHDAGAAAAGIIVNPANELRCEIAVVGSGPGGAITTCLLAEAGRDVLLIEEGPFYSLESCAPFTKEEMQQKYRNGGQTVAFGKTKIAYVEGRCVGGGSEINSGLYHRTPPEILETWRKEFQVESLQEQDLLPHFEACEKELSVSLSPDPPAAAALKLHEGALQLGWKSLEVPRWFNHSATQAGKRQSMTKTFIPRFLRAGGKLLPETRIERIQNRAGKWRLQGRHAAGQLGIEGDYLFLAGGAVQTPALLRRSGITRTIGDSLRLHPTVKIVARFGEQVNSAELGVPAHQVKEFAPRLSFGCSISSPPYLALGLADYAEEARQVGHTWPQLATYYAMITGEGRGTVRCVAKYRDPLVRYQLTESDRRDLAEGIRKLAQILFQTGAIALYPGLVHGPRLMNKDDLSMLPERVPAGFTNLMTIHVFSSCPMGEDQRKCAADSFGRVHGHRNLFLSDASLLCTAPGVNPQGSIMALARRNALHFLGR